MAAQRSEKQQALVAKYQTRDITIDNVADIVNDIFDVVDNVANPLSWFQLFADGWSIANMSSSQASAAQNLQDLVDKVSGMASDLDEIKQTLAEQGLTQDEINAKLDIIMAQQQADTEAILNSISDVGSMVSQMWANTVSWLSSMQQQLSAVQDMLRGINDAIKDLVAQLDQLKSEVQWGSIVGTMAEYQLRISYACEMAQNIYVGTSSNNTESSSSDQAPQAPQTQYDAQELTRWAREVTSLASGIQYHLDGMHKLIMGDYVLGKPLMYLYALTFANAAVPDPKAARIYAYMVAVQCQGFATLAKAREFLGLRSLGDVKALCKARIDEQIEVVSASYLAAAKDGAWVGANGPTAMQYATQPLSGTRIIIVDNNRDVVSGLRLGPTNNNVQLLTSALVPGTSRVENQYKTVDKAHDGGIVRWYYCCQTTNSPNAVVNWTSTPIIVKDEYPIVGVVLQTSPPGIFPICSGQWNKDQGTTGWDGSGGTLYVAKPSPLGDGSMHVGTGQQYTLGGPDSSNLTPGMMRGLKVTAEPGAKTLRLHYLSNGLLQDTWLPFPFDETPGLTYEPLATPLAGTLEGGGGGGGGGEDPAGVPRAVEE